MRVVSIAGLLLVLGGAYLRYNGGSFTTQRQLFKVGDVKLTAKEEHPVAPWMAGAAIVAGVALVVVGARRKG